MAKTKQEGIFKQASISHYYSNILFPKEIRQKVTTLYAFVRLGDDYVDSSQRNEQSIDDYHQLFQKAYLGTNVDHVVVDDFVSLIKEIDIPIEWVESYFESMFMDLSLKKYQTLSDLKIYIYGCAEVIGLMMCKIMNLDQKSYKYGKLLARSMQYANFIRDIDEDNQLGRTYFPQSDLKKFGLKDLQLSTVKNSQEQFESFLQTQIERYTRWHLQAIKGYQFIPNHYLPAVKTAADMYDWTTKQIQMNPTVVFDRKIKPTKYQVLLTGIGNYIYSYTR